MGLPDANQRLNILKIHTKGWRTDFESLRDFTRFLKVLAAHKTEGFSGADLKAFCNETYVNAIHRCCPQLKTAKGYDESIASRLRDGVIIQKGDFEKTIADGFKPSRSRSGDGGGHRGRFDPRDIELLGCSGKETVRRLLHRVDVYVNRSKHGDPGSVPSKAMDVDSSDDDVDIVGEYVRSANQARVLSKCNDRLMICGDDARKKRIVLQTLLRNLDIANVQYVSFAVMAATVSREEMYHSVLDKLKLAITAGIGVLVFSDLDISLSHYPQLMENVVMSNVSEMARDHNMLVVATAKSWKSTDCWSNEWPQTVFRFFDKDTFHVQ